VFGLERLASKLSDGPTRPPLDAFPFCPGFILLLGFICGNSFQLCRTHSALHSYLVSHFQSPQVPAHLMYPVPNLVDVTSRQDTHNTDGQSPSAPLPPMPPTGPPTLAPSRPTPPPRPPKPPMRPPTPPSRPPASHLMPAPWMPPPLVRPRYISLPDLPPPYTFMPPTPPPHLAGPILTADVRSPFPQCYSSQFLPITLRPNHSVFAVFSLEGAHFWPLQASKFEVGPPELNRLFGAYKRSYVTINPNSECFQYVCFTTGFYLFDFDRINAGSCSVIGKTTGLFFPGKHSSF
jgi:hypothetical protein